MENLDRLGKQALEKLKLKKEITLLSESSFRKPSIYVSILSTIASVFTAIAATYAVFVTVNSNFFDIERSKLELSTLKLEQKEYRLEESVRKLKIKEDSLRSINLNYISEIAKYKSVAKTAEERFRINEVKKKTISEVRKDIIVLFSELSKSINKHNSDYDEAMRNIRNDRAKGIVEMDNLSRNLLFEYNSNYKPRAIALTNIMFDLKPSLREKVSPRYRNEYNLDHINPLGVKSAADFLAEIIEYTK